MKVNTFLIQQDNISACEPIYFLLLYSKIILLSFKIDFVVSNVPPFPKGRSSVLTSDIQFILPKGTKASVKLFKRKMFISILAHVLIARINAFFFLFLKVWNLELGTMDDIPTLLFVLAVANIVRWGPK